MCKYRIYCSGCRSNVYSGEYKICKTYINYVVHVLDIATHVLLGKHIPGITFAPFIEASQPTTIPIRLRFILRLKNGTEISVIVTAHLPAALLLASPILTWELIHGNGQPLDFKHIYIYIYSEHEQVKDNFKCGFT